MGSGSGSTAQGGSFERSLKIEQVLVSEGQEVAEGDPIYLLTEDSVETLRSQLESDVNSAAAVLAQTQTQKQLTELEARQTYETNIAYGSLAQAEYRNTVEEKQEAVEETQEQIEELQEELAGLIEQQEEYTADLAMQKKVLSNAEYLVSSTDILSDTYSWLTAENAREETEAAVEELENKIEEITGTTEEKTKELEQLRQSLTGAQRDLELAEIDAQAQLEIRQFRYANA